MTIGSGGSGGIFGPSMVIGGLPGRRLGRIATRLVAAICAAATEIFAIVGMAGFFAGAAHAPISTIIMVSEMTGDYGLLLPTMWVSTLCFSSVIAGLFTMNSFHRRWNRRPIVAISWWMCWKESTSAMCRSNSDDRCFSRHVAARHHAAARLVATELFSCCRP